MLDNEQELALLAEVKSLASTLTHNINNGISVKHVRGAMQGAMNDYLAHTMYQRPFVLDNMPKIDSGIFINDANQAASSFKLADEQPSMVFNENARVKLFQHSNRHYPSENAGLESPFRIALPGERNEALRLYYTVDNERKSKQMIVGDKTHDEIKQKLCEFFNEVAATYLESAA